MEVLPYWRFCQMPKMSKRSMIQEMQDCDWPVSCSEEDSYEIVKEEYEIFLDEYNDDSDMFPNGRDEDAEDEDGPF